jgi:hypothetical protein
MYLFHRYNPLDVYKYLMIKLHSPRVFMALCESNENFLDKNFIRNFARQREDMVLSVDR